jgi:hypothetical protein
VSEQPTTLDEISRIGFLRSRLDSVLNSILVHPDRTVLWIGAGLSAKYGGLPTWRAFLLSALSKNSVNEDELAILTRLVELGKFTLAAEYLNDVFGERFPTLLAETFAQPKGGLPAPLGYLNVRDIITTNYDMLLETIMPWYRPVFPSEGVEKLLLDECKIVKIHGSIAAPQSCIASVSNYANAYNSNLHWYLVNVFSRNKVIFMGTSMDSSEPYFRTLKFLKENSRMDERHVAIMAVKDSEHGKQQGKRLQNFGIELLPYVPDREHSFLDELFNSIDAHRGKAEPVRARLALVRNYLQAGKDFSAAALLWHTCHADIATTIRRDVGDVVSSFFQQSLSRSPKERYVFIENCKLHFDLTQLWFRAAELILPSTKSAHGLRASLEQLESAYGKSLPFLRQKMNKIDANLSSKFPEDNI